MALRDLDLLVNVTNLKFVYPEMMRVSAKNAQNDFYRFGYLPTRFTPNDLDFLLKVKHFKLQYLRNSESM